MSLVIYILPPIKLTKTNKPKKLFENKEDFISCKTALEEGVPGTKQSPSSLKKAANQELTKHSKDVLKRLMNTKEGQNVWQLDDEFGLPNVKSARMSNIYKKLGHRQIA